MMKILKGILIIIILAMQVSFVMAKNSKISPEKEDDVLLHWKKELNTLLMTVDLSGIGSTEDLKNLINKQKETLPAQTSFVRIWAIINKMWGDEYQKCKKLALVDAPVLKHTLLHLIPDQKKEIESAFAQKTEEDKVAMLIDLYVLSKIKRDNSVSATEINFETFKSIYENKTEFESIQSYSRYKENKKNAIVIGNTYNSTKARVKIIRGLERDGVSAEFLMTGPFRPFAIMPFLRKYEAIERRNNVCNITPFMD